MGEAPAKDPLLVRWEAWRAEFPDDCSLVCVLLEPEGEGQGLKVFGDNLEVQEAIARALVPQDDKPQNELAA